MSVRALLEVRNQGSLAGALAQRLANVVDHLLDFFRLKAAVVSSFRSQDVLLSSVLGMHSCTHSTPAVWTCTMLNHHASLTAPGLICDSALGMACRTACMLLSGRSVSLTHPSYLQSKLVHLQHQGMPHRLGITMLRVQLQGNEAHLVLSLQHLPQGQRRFAPLGVLSCSDICAGLLWKLGPSLEPHQRNFLEQYKVLHDFLTTSLSSARYYMTYHIALLAPHCTTLCVMQPNHKTWTNWAPAVAVLMTWGKQCVV